MALEADIFIPALGVNATYHRILDEQKRRVRDTDMPGSVGTLVVEVLSYASKAVSDANGPSIGSHTVRLRYGAGIGAVPEKLAGNPVIRSDDPTTADIYGALTELPTFSGAAAV